jgi:hypothetical protein
MLNTRTGIVSRQRDLDHDRIPHLRVLRELHAHQASEAGDLRHSGQHARAVYNAH